MRCSGEEELRADRIVLPIAASISILSYLLIFYFYYYKKVPTLKRHPTALGVKKCLFELVFVSQYLWIPFTPRSFFWQNYSDDQDDDEACIASNWAGFFSFVTQLSLLGGELWFLVLTMDLHFACTNPFTSYKLNAQRYEIFVWGSSILSAMALVIAGPKVYGLSSDLTCWIQDTTKESENNFRYNTAKTLLFYLWMGAIYSYCLYVVLFVFQRLKQGLSETLHTRLSTVRRAQTYVLGYFIYWIFPLVFSFVDFVFENSSHRTLRTLSAFFYAIRGLFSAIILLTPNWSEMKTFLDATNGKRSGGLGGSASGGGLTTDGLVQNVVEEDLSLRPHLNTALRAEIIFFTTQGIRYASRQATKNLQPKHERGKESLKRTSRGFTSGVLGLQQQIQPQQPPLPPQQEDLGSPTLDDSKVVRTFLCNDISKTTSSTSEAIGSPFHLPLDTLEDLQRLEVSQRESISEGEIEADLEDALDNIGLYDTRTEKHHTLNQRSQRLPGPGSSREREYIENPLAPIPTPVVNATLKTSLLVGNSSSRDEALNGSSNLSANSISHEGSESGRQSETEFRLFLDREPQSIEKRRSHPRNHPLTSSSSGAAAPTNSTLTGGSAHLSSSNGNGTELNARDRVKKNLSLAFVSRERFQLSRRIPNDFLFKDYLPQLFAEVRETCGIDPQEYFDAFQKTTKEKFSEGRSGAFLYFSSNQKYIVKTTTRSENQALLDIMKEYLSYLIANPNSLIVRFLGAHSLTMYGRVLYFVVMLNVFSKAELSERYDLKGSWVQRHGDDSQRRQKLTSGKSGSPPLYKDNDLQHKITLNPEVANALHDQIFRDTAFLSGLGLMDYSLLVGVVRRKFEVMERTTSLHTSSDTAPTAFSSTPDIFQRDGDGGMHAAVVEGPGTYYMGIIDVLQEWNWEKKLERFFKIYFKWMDPEGLSAAPPQKYVDRFMKRCVVEVFDGLYVADSDFNPKMRNVLHGNSHRNLSRPALLDGDMSDEGGRDNATGEVDTEAADSLQLSVDRFRVTTGIDRRFSAAPLSLDNGNSLQLVGRSTLNGQNNLSTLSTTSSQSRYDVSTALEEGFSQSELELECTEK